MNSDDDLAARLRAICLALPEVTERASHGVPTWFVRDKKSFAQLWADGHHGDDFPHLWCAGLPGAQEALIGSAPDRFFRPPYVGHRGWIGARLDGDVDWTELAELCADAYRAVAPAAHRACARDTRLLVQPEPVSATPRSLPAVASRDQTEASYWEA